MDALDTEMVVRTVRFLGSCAQMIVPPLVVVACAHLGKRLKSMVEAIDTANQIALATQAGVAECKVQLDRGAARFENHEVRLVAVETHVGIGGNR